MWLLYHVSLFHTKPHKQREKQQHLIHLKYYMLSCLHSVFICSHLFRWWNLHFTQFCGRFSFPPHRVAGVHLRLKGTHAQPNVNAITQLIIHQYGKMIASNSIQGLRSAFNHAICMAGVNLHICQKCCKCFSFSPFVPHPAVATFRNFPLRAARGDQPEFDPEA